MLGRRGRKINIGIVGLGGRGRWQLGELLKMEDVDVVAVCDSYEDRVQNGIGDIKAKRGVVAAGYTDHRGLVNRDDIEAVFVVSSWTSHIRIALDAMKAGKYVATEVGGASSLQECWDLVRMSEQTGMPCMMLENCCYGREEMALLNMVKKGIFGEVIHCQGGYEHDLREEICNGDVNRHYRRDHFTHRNGELYPTHELGPISKWLGINRGNRMTMLTSMASKTRGLELWMKEHRRGDPIPPFTQGDIVTTMIKCAHGETIVLTHDCSLPRPYSRGGRLQGTRGIWMEDNRSLYIEGLTKNKDGWDSFDDYIDQFDHPLWKAYANYGLRDGHGGMDYLVVRAFIESVQNRTETPIDVYDTASWMSVMCLSEQSVAMGSLPVPVPDFTDGRWINRDKAAPGLFALDDIYEEMFR
jgi:predicted dehydrogenase